MVNYLSKKQLPVELPYNPENTIFRSSRVFFWCLEKVSGGNTYLDVVIDIKKLPNLFQKNSVFSFLDGFNDYLDNSKLMAELVERMI